MHSNSICNRKNERFNEAGADCPGMRADFRRPSRAARDASMRPGQTAPECEAAERPPEGGKIDASMRPGQTAPECGQLHCQPDLCRQCFNEAGADCPGMPALSAVRMDRFPAASMRPGQTAPECARRYVSHWHSAPASMRPGQTAPECVESASMGSAH